MEHFTDTEIKKFIELANVYFSKAFPKGAKFTTIQIAEEIALRKYLKFYTKNIQKGKIALNSACKKARLDWFILETIEKIYKMNELQEAKSLNYCIANINNQIQLFRKQLQKEAYLSYIDDQELDM